MKDQTFLIDSDHAEAIRSRLCGYMVTDDGRIFFDEIPQKDGRPLLSDTGIFSLVLREGYRITVRQDFCGSYGIYLWRGGAEPAGADHTGAHRTVISNSFFRLAEYLHDELHVTLTPNRTAVQALLLTDDAPYLRRETLANEIEKLDSDEYAVLDAGTGRVTVERKHFPYYTRKLRTADDFERLDAWYFKWVRVFRNLAEAGFPIETDLSGGLDTRLILAMLRSGNITVPGHIRVNTHIKVNMEKDVEDLRIAREIANDLGLTLNDGECIPETVSAADDPEPALRAQKYLTLSETTMQKYTYADYDVPHIHLKGLGSTTKGGFWSLPRHAFYAYSRSSRPYADAVCDAAFVRHARDLTRDYVRDLTHGSRFVSPDLLACYLYKKIKIEKRDMRKAVYGSAFRDYAVSPFIDPVISEFDYRGALEHPPFRNILFLNAVLFDRYDRELLRYDIQGRAFSPRDLKKARELNERFPCAAPSFEPLTPHARPSAVARMETAELVSRLEQTWNDPAFAATVSRFAGPEMYRCVLAALDRDRINTGGQPVNALLALFEFSKLL